MEPTHNQRQFFRHSTKFPMELMHNLWQNISISTCGTTNFFGMDAWSQHTIKIIYWKRREINFQFLVISCVPLGASLCLLIILRATLFWNDIFCTHKIWDILVIRIIAFIWISWLITSSNIFQWLATCRFAFVYIT